MAEPLSPSEQATYIASAHLADLIRDLREHGLLEGEVRVVVAESVEEFRKHRTGDPAATWHSDLFDVYEELHGKTPELFVGQQLQSLVSNHCGGSRNAKSGQGL